jgi:PKD repeat protein
LDVIGPGSPVTLYVDDPDPTQFGMPCIDNNGDILVYKWKYEEPRMVLKISSGEGAAYYTPSPDESWVGQTWHLNVTVDDGDNTETTFKRWEITFAYLDEDTDNMPDSWEIDYFLDTMRDGTGDFDDDGLNDFDEYLYGTDPTDKDSNNDGLEDGYKVNNGMDPLSYDSDQDGMPDNWEVANLLDPAVDDAHLDKDNDCINNIVEYWNLFDPNLPPPVITVSASSRGMSVAFNSQSDSEVTLYVWDFGDGSEPEYGISPVHTYDAPGEYNVMIYAEGPGGSTTEIETITVSEDSNNKAAIVPIIQLLLME